MIDFAKIRAALAAIVDKAHQELHDLIGQIEGQAAADVHTVGEQVADDVHTAETDAHQAASDTGQTLAAPTDQPVTPAGP